MDDLQAELLETQINRLKDNIESRFQRIEATINHHSTLESEKQNQIKSGISDLKKCLDDHENRIRTIDDAVIANKTTTTLIQAGQAALTLIAASIAAWLGRK
jgi:hypothetical protein